MADFDDLVTTAHAHDIKIIIDIVPNHTSDQHPWFLEAAASPPGSPARNRCIFRPGDAEHPPSDWFGEFSVERQENQPHSTLRLYRDAFANGKPCKLATPLSPGKRWTTTTCCTTAGPTAGNASSAFPTSHNACHPVKPSSAANRSPTERCLPTRRPGFRPTSALGNDARSKTHECAQWQTASTRRRRATPEPMVLLIHQHGSDMSHIHTYLESAAFRVRRATSYPTAVGMARCCHPDVVVLQTDTTDNGLQLMRQILSERAVPVIILAPADHSDPVQALEHGADDYMINPPALSELAARARGAARRSRQRVRRVGELELDAQSRHARASNRRLSLTPTEYSILEFLAQTPGHTVTHHDLVQAIGGPGENSTSKLVPRIAGSV